MPTGEKELQYPALVLRYLASAILDGKPKLQFFLPIFCKLESDWRGAMPYKADDFYVRSTISSMYELYYV